MVSYEGSGSSTSPSMLMCADDTIMDTLCGDICIQACFE
eukprot:CAMPEP_0204621226 /NCGR_PEP_ID=MMETSP0717-20131115/7011_1 /ASSEMBLY_ACC=CAM_ASM_000666 /TAXON_ID=230516 /ORGANISM="Chaetoceros curvisetus" /LENGTH=38 /DNA_ID= /DNA_START= /DNA_END= /DNA_ORIENTATION=